MAGNCWNGWKLAGIAVKTVNDCKWPEMAGMAKIAGNG